jgi:amidohydrolase
VTIGLGEPALVNDEGLAEELGRSLAATGLWQAPHLRSCGADDFAYFTELVPGVMVFYGVGEADGTGPGLHSARFLPDDEHVRGVATAMIAGYFGAQRHLGRRG